MENSELEACHEVRSKAPVLIISTPKTGHVNQCIAFCEEAGWPMEQVIRLPKAMGLPKTIAKPISDFKRIVLARKIVRRYGKDPLLRVVASGVSSEAVVQRLRRNFGPRLFAVFIGTPRRAGLRIFDAAVSSRHEIADGGSENLSLAEHTAWIDGTLVRRVASGPVPVAPHLTVLIGGANRTYELKAAAIATQVSGMLDQLGLARQDATLVFSRRTPRDLADSLGAMLPGAHVVPATDRTGFEHAYARASHLAVTPDSITMICEACASGRPVGVFAVDSHNDDSSAARFIASFRSAGHIAWGRLPSPGESLSVWNPGAAVHQVVDFYERGHLPEARAASMRPFGGSALHGLALPWP